jgi:hypothetical protein
VAESGRLTYTPSMVKRTPETIGAELSVPERMLLFCLASGTDWAKAGVTHATAQHMLVKNLVERDQAANRFMLTEQGRAVLFALIGHDRR